jgi:hypothetical protein
MKSIITKTLVICGAIMVTSIKIFGESTINNLKNDYTYTEEEIVIEEPVEIEYQEPEIFIEEVEEEEIIEKEKPIFPNDSLTNQLIQVGDKVRVIDAGQIYNQYKDYLDVRNISIDYWGNKDYEHNGIDEESAKEEQKKNNKPEQNKLYTVMYINYHDTLDDCVLSIIMDEEGYYFIMNINALQLENGQNIKDINNSNNDNDSDDVWIDENGIIRYTPGRNNVTTNEPTDEYVYWTYDGKSYHSRKSCPSLANSSNIQEGTDCPKNDPCNNCCK